jgi:hypothetical protein
MGKFNPGGNRRHAVINGDFLRPTGAPIPDTIPPSHWRTRHERRSHPHRPHPLYAHDRWLAVLTVIADFNRTHATNPEWTPHARFHVVWQISSYVGFGLLALALIWWPGPLAVERLYLVALMGAIVYAAFFAALIAMPIYGGAAYDKNGYQPFKAPIPIIAKRWDANITAFSIQLVILAAGLLAVSGVFAG